MNIVEHLMDFHMPIFRLERLSEGYHQLILDSPNEFLDGGVSNVGNVLIS